jgi:hypothetical protein
LSNTLTDFDPTDNWADLLDGENPIVEAREVGDGITSDQYKEQPNGVQRGHPFYVLSGGDLAEFNNCPSKWLEGVEDEGTKSTDWGSLIDCLLMAPNELEERFVVPPENYPGPKGELKPWNFNATYCQEWKEEQGDKIIIKAEFMENAKHAANLVLHDPQIAEVFAASRKQVMLTGIYLDADTGLRIPVKALLDLAPQSGFLADLKTCRNAHKKAWKRQVYDCGYHEQAARHLDLWNAAHSDNRREFRHYIQENFKPYQTAKRILDPAFIKLGRDSYTMALKRYAKALKTKEWPDYDTTGDLSDLVINGHLVTSPEAWMVGV